MSFQTRPSDCATKLYLSAFSRILTKEVEYVSPSNYVAHLLLLRRFPGSMTRLLLHT